MTGETQAAESGGNLRKFVIAALVLAALIAAYLLYLTTRAELPGQFSKVPVQKISGDDQAKRARDWIAKAKAPDGTQYAEGEVEPEMKGVTLEPLPLFQGRKQDETPEKLPEALSSVIAAVNQPFRKTFDSLPNFTVTFSFENTSSEPKLGKVTSKGTVKFTKDAKGDWQAAYDISTDSPKQTYQKPIYKSQFWLIGNQAFIKHPGDARAAAINEQSSEDDQQLLNTITSNQIDLLSHDFLRKWVNETKQAIGFEAKGTNTWLGRTVDVYNVGPTHYQGENPGIRINAKDGFIWIDREFQIPIKADLLYDGVMTIPSPQLHTYDTREHVKLEINLIGNAPTVVMPQVAAGNPSK